MTSDLKCYQGQMIFLMSSFISESLILFLFWMVEASGICCCWESLIWDSGCYFLLDFFTIESALVIKVEFWCDFIFKSFIGFKFTWEERVPPKSPSWPFKSFLIGEDFSETVFVSSTTGGWGCLDLDLLLISLILLWNLSFCWFLVCLISFLWLIWSPF